MQLLRKTIFATLFIATSCLAACSSSNDDPAPGPGNGGEGGGESGPTYKSLAYAYGSYYHKLWGDQAGDYYLVLTDKDLDNANSAPYKYRIDIDFLSVLATNANVARPLDGEYTIGTSESNKAGVFIEGFLGQSPSGDISAMGTYWNEPDDKAGISLAHAIVGGKMRITTQDGITTIKAEFVDENDSTLHVSYQGALIFENRANESYRGDSRLTEDYTMNPDAPVVSIKKITGECTAEYDRWDLYFYEKVCYDTQGKDGCYIWLSLKTAPGQDYIPAGSYNATVGNTPGFMPGDKASTGSETAKAVYTWLNSGRTPHAPLTSGNVTIKTTDGSAYEISLSMGDDHPLPYQVKGSFKGTVMKLSHPEIG